MCEHKQSKHGPAWHTALLMLLDAFLTVAAMMMALQIYYDMEAPQAHIVHVWHIAPILAVLTVGFFYAVGLYKTLMRYASVEALVQIATGALLASGTTYLFSLVCYTIQSEPNVFLMPRPVYLVHWLLLLLLVGGSRFSLRIIGQGGVGILPRRRSRGKRVMVVGAGWAGAQVIREIQAGRYGDCTAVLAVDDNEAKRGAALGRVPVLMDTHKVGEYVQQYRVDEIIIAIATPNGDLSELIHRCIDTGCHVRMVSTLRDVNTGAPALGRVREVNIGDLLGRAEKHLDMTEVEAYFAGKRVLVTGGGGSIGSELCRQIMSFTPAKLVLYDISENYIYDLFFELQEKYGALTRNTVELRVGSIRDKATLDRVFSEFQPEIVIHAAAHKHVPLMEDSPEQAIINNVFGTLNVAQCSLEHGVKRFVMISTDKAVNPTNIMGASKRMAEIIIEALQARGKTQFTAVRFGNVLGSNGSVVPLFERQIRAGGPVTLTHPDIIRYFMTIPEAASLVLQAASIAKGGELFVLDMGKPVKIRELAERMIQLYADPNGPPVEIIYTGLRPGEKLYEELLRDEENSTATSKEKIFIAKPEQVAWPEVERMLRRLRECLDAGGDIRACMHELLPSYHEPQPISAEEATAQARLETKAG
ncbi:MAG TPA: polysaccharide biosynthesis protein [Candidatus Egerieenecus merdigallinarum]|nr:polysaccharide biosynthesis protein [Candidatus Egerieenecus merdigallinarum]